MFTEVALTRLVEAGLDEAGEIQARAFFDDPVFEFVFPDGNQRRERLPWLMHIGLAYGARFGHVETTAGSMLGHAVWVPPGDGHVTPEKLAEVGFVEPELRLGNEGLSRFGAFMTQIEAAHERLVPEPHWYLMILGVDPPHQGRGVGGTLIRPILARADAEGVRCYLETAKERNLAFYRRHGFEVAAEDDVPDGPHVWMMTREPR
jgi:ribosomal protein S18 acetylase RimI-like enzyme